MMIFKWDLFCLLFLLRKENLAFLTPIKISMPKIVTVDFVLSRRTTKCCFVKQILFFLVLS